MTANEVAPQGAGRNWQPAETIDDYLANCREGLEEYSLRRAAQLLGWPRMKLHRAIMMSHLPEEVFEALLAADVLSTKALGDAGEAWLKGDDRQSADVECCPHCGGVIRVRHRLSERARAVFAQFGRKVI